MEENPRGYIWTGVFINVIVIVGFVVLIAKAFQPDAGTLPQNTADVDVPATPAVEQTTTGETTVNTASERQVEPVAVNSGVDLVASSQVAAAFNKGGCAGCHSGR